MKDLKKDKIRIIPLGGFDKIGMNMTLIESEDSIIAIDCGASFPPSNMPGVDALIPDISYIKENKERFKGIILTHGHEDHIGALPYILLDVKAPVYGTPLTIALVEEKLKTFGIKNIKTRAITLGKTIVVGDFKIEFIRAIHSIPDSAMLAIYTSAGILFHTGDFKIDLSPVLGKNSDLSRLSILGEKGVLAVLSDSTNAMRDGFSETEQFVNSNLDKLFSINSQKRIIIVSFASNMSRVQEILNLGKKYNRKVVLDGNVMMSIFKASVDLGYIQVDEDILVEMSDINKYKDNEIVILTTGSHGDSLQCISGIASGERSDINIKDNDVVLFSSVPIYGNASDFNIILSRLEEHGAIVEFQDIHATGHACAGEIKLLYSTLKPKFVIPAHGEYRFRREAKRIAKEVGIKSENIFLINNGDILELGADSCRISGKLSLEVVLIDGYEKREIDVNVIKDREKLSQSGVVVIEMCIDKKTGRYASKLNITSRGFVDEHSNKDLFEGLTKVVLQELSRYVNQGVKGERVNKGICRKAEWYIETVSGKKPIVIANITEVMV
ncbi:ribonuclease J [Pseudobutyrivibrio sp.]|uniref:ribonuclease J n=1 Tax=Pseudobutyrivibrio sp. TaxID=2014367 RepID=UPI0025F54C70|nr:ribonuclease J [Pseudobutyrivibrio sp.]